MLKNAYQPGNYDALLKEKVAAFSTLFANSELPPLAVFTSPKKNFRMRAEFRIWHDSDRCFYAMFEPEEPKKPVEITQFPIGSTSIESLMPKLLSRINNSNELKQRLFQAEFLSTTTGEILVTLIYHRPLGDAWLAIANEIEQSLSIRIIGRSRKQRLLVSEDTVLEKLLVGNREFSYYQQENGFTQPNAAVNTQMLCWAQQYSRASDGDLLELYCGNGNFTAVLAQNFRAVLATEISKVSVNIARQNFKRNGNENITIVRLSAAEISQALTGVRAFRRLKDVDLTSYNFSTVFVDPPRAGLDDLALDLVEQFDRIIYISCNPQTLNENTLRLSKNYFIEEAAVFDQFPYTKHLEAGLIFKRRAC